MKRGIFPDNVVRLVRKVEQEFELFRFKMLAKSREEIFEGCDIIRFYSCIYEYFLYKEELAEEHINVCLKYEDVIATLYYLYLKYEYLRYSRWEDIEDMLDVLVRVQENDGGNIVLQT